MPDPKQIDPKRKAYQDSLALYNKGQLDKKKYLLAMKQMGIDSGELQKITAKETLDYFDGKIKPIAARYANPSGTSSTRNNKGEYVNYYGYFNKDGSETKIYNPKNKEFLEKGFLEYKKPTGKFSDDNKGIKEYPPIYTNNPKDPRIGQYHEDGRRYTYKEDVKTVKPRVKLNSLDLNLIPQGITPTDQQLNTPKLYPQAQIAKSYKIHEEHGNSTTDYEVTDPNNINTDMNRKQTIRPQYAKGGEITQYNAGGSHEQNPMGGVPLGPNASIEQGEASTNTPDGKFIYSDRVMITEKAALEHNIPKRFVGKTVADYAKKLDSQFKDRTDKISTSTKKALLARGAKAQEQIKAEQMALAQAMQANSTEVPDMMNGETPQGVKQFLLGGETNTGGPSGGIFGYTAGDADEFGDLINKGGSKGPSTVAADGASGGSGISGYYGMIGQAAGMLGSAIGAGNQSPTSHNALLTDGERSMNQGYESVKSGVAAAIPIAGLFNGVEKLGKSLGQSIGGDKGGDIAQGFLDPFSNVMRKDTNFGDKLLSVADPIVAGLITNKKNNKRRAELSKNMSMSLNGMFNDTGMALGGHVKKMAPGGILPTKKPIAGIAEDVYNNFNLNGDGTLNDTDLTKDLAGQYNQSKAYDMFTSYSDLGKQDPAFIPSGGGLKRAGKATADWLGQNYGSMMRYAPVATNALQLAQLKKPQFQALNRLNNRYKPSYVDEAAMQNTVDQELNNVSNAIQSSGGSQGAVRNALLAAQLNKTKARSDAYAQAKQMNAGQDAVAQNFNLGIDQSNIQQSNLEMDINDHNQANYRNQKSKLISALGEDVGTIGKEEVNKDQVAAMFGYTWKGKYMVDKDGNRVTPEQISAAKKALEQQQSSATAQKALGGYIMTKKK